MIRHVFDRFTLIAIALIVIIRMLAWIYLPPINLYAIIPLVFLAFVMYNIKHNHLHFNIFRHSKLNFLLENIMNIVTGTTFSSMKIIHLINHHATENKEGDWGRTKQFEQKSNLKSVTGYTLATLVSFVKNKRTWLNNREGHVLKRRAQTEALILLVVYAIMLIVNPWNTLMYILIPHAICQFILIAFNYLQHGACDADSPYNNSRNFTGKVLNFLLFNNGFHTVHHLKPALHWTEYPAFHASIKDRIDHHLNVDNFLIFLVKQTIKPKRKLIFK